MDSSRTAHALREDSAERGIGTLPVEARLNGGAIPDQDSDEDDEKTRNDNNGESPNRDTPERRGAQRGGSSTNVCASRQALSCISRALNSKHRKDFLV